MERKVSAMISRRAPASAATSEGPLVATQANFICGSAEILETPLSVKVSVSALVTKLLRRGRLLFGSACA